LGTPASSIPGKETPLLFNEGGKEQQKMAIRAIIFDLGETSYKEGEPLGPQGSNLSLYENERLNTDLARFVGDLRPRYKIATICNGGSREAVNRKFRLGDLVDLMVFDGEEGISKPDGRIYQRALLRLGVQPHEVVFVDDKERNVVAAELLGMHTVQFKTTAQAIAEIHMLLQK
jgi:beta-phosphoglucomutase-like phosphatase (HAD superfamily)